MVHPKSPLAESHIHFDSDKNPYSGKQKAQKRKADRKKHKQIIDRDEELGWCFNLAVAERNQTMKPEELSQLTDEQLLELAKHNKPSPVIDAFFIGFLIGIIIYGAIVNALGFLSVIPLFLIYKFLKKPQQHKDLMNELEKRGLK